MSTTGEQPSASTPTRESWAGRRVFIMAAIGSAVGLGNIWRFPYVAYEHGGGAFLIPYLVALLSAGIPLLFLDYAVGHKFRGSPPVAFRRLHRRAEAIGWWQVAICAVIAVYYAVVVAWAGRYMFFSVSKSWGDDPAGFFVGDYLRVSEDFAPGLDFVAGVLVPLVIVWVVTIGVLALGVQKGIARSSVIFLPLLLVMFVVLVIQALLLPGAVVGLNAFFTPSWGALADPGVWIAAYGQIFFSLSVAFGIMVTYSSYLKKKTDLTGSGFVVAFSNSGFEILAGIGVFAAVGFMAQASGVGVSEVATEGVGLAFIAFPAIISQAPGGALLGVLFFGSLVFAGFTSLVSILEVTIASVQDKTRWPRRTATLAVGIPMAITSILLFSTTTGLNLLDVTDSFVNNFGIVSVAFVAVVLLSYAFRALPKLAHHLNKTSSFKVGLGWRIMVGVVAPIVLGVILVSEAISRIKEGYGDPPMPGWFVGVFGWGMVIALVVFAVIMSLLPWASHSAAHRPSEDALDLEEDLR